METPQTNGVVAPFFGTLKSTSTADTSATATPSIWTGLPQQQKPADFLTQDSRREVTQQRTSDDDRDDHADRVGERHDKTPGVAAAKNQRLDLEKAKR